MHYKIGTTMQVFHFDISNRKRKLALPTKQINYTLSQKSVQIKSNLIPEKRNTTSGIEFNAIELDKSAWIWIRREVREERKKMYKNCISQFPNKLIV